MEKEIVEVVAAGVVGQEVEKDRGAGGGTTPHNKRPLIISSAPIHTIRPIRVHALATYEMCG